MKHSEQINELATALAKAQGEMENAAKDKLNPHFRSKYADLGNVWDAIREPLSRHGLSVVQLPFTDESGTVRLSTMILHASGQFLEADYALPPTKPDAQGYGSAITYMKRYALTGLGIAPEDDDGNAASARSGNAPSSRAAEPRGETPAKAEDAITAFLKRDVLTIPVRGAKAGHPEWKDWDAAMRKAIDHCETFKTLDKLWGDNGKNFADYAAADSNAAAARKLEAHADMRRDELTPPAIMAAE